MKTRTTFASRLGMFGMALLMVLSLLAVPASAEHIPTPTSGKYISCYPLASSGKVYAYTDASLTQKTGGYVVPSDECRILAIQGNSIYVSYPRDSGGRREAWFPASAFTNFNLNGDLQTATATAKITTYRRAGGPAYGSVSRNDKVFLLGSSNGYTQLLYPVGSRWKLAVIRTSDAERCLNGSGSTGTTSSLSCPIQPGTYVLVPKCAPDSAIEVRDSSRQNGAAISIWNRAFQNGKIIPTMTFRVEVIGKDTIILYNVNSGKAIDVDSQRTDSGAVLHQWDLPSSDKYVRKSTMWRVKDAGNGYYYLINVNSGKALDISGASSANGTRAVQYTPNGTSAQAIKFYAADHFNTKSSNSLTAVLVSNTWDYPMTNTYVCGNEWSEYYAPRAKQGRPDHCGIDIASRNGSTAVYAAADGTVAAKGYNSSNGKFVVLKHTINGQTVYSFYAHLSSYENLSGFVSKGTKIGTMGNSGSSSDGDHVHFAIANKLNSKGGYVGYTARFSDSANKVTYNGTTFYNPHYVVKNDRLPG